MIHRIVLFLIFAHVFGRLIEPLWNRNKNKLPLTVNSSELWIQTLIKSKFLLS